MSNRILILFSHPLFEKSHANAAMVRYIPESEFITFHDLYECYPDFDIDVKREQELLPCTYYHVVFTLPQELNPLALHNPALVYDALFSAVWQT